MRMPVCQRAFTPLLLPLMACAETPLRQNSLLSAGERAIDETRGLQAAEYGERGNDMRIWGGQQLPNIPAAPHL